MPKKLDPWVKAARLADEFIDAVERFDGTQRRANIAANRRDKLMVALVDTAVKVEEGTDDGEADTPATVAPAQV
jgi:hypothetical protein